MVPDIAKKGHSFTGAFAYYLHDKREGDGQHPQTSERVAWTETRNLMTDNPDTARKIMTATAMQSDQLKKAAGVKAAGRKSTQHVYAYALSWHPDEAEGLTKADMIAAADSSLKELEADHLQSVVVCHTDQKHPHIHVIVNRVDPSDGRMHGFKNDRLILSDWANRYERERGQLVTPAREEKRKKREQYQDKQKRLDYAKQKRAEAAARPKDDLSPAAMLKDLGDAQKARHRQEWQELSASNKDRRTAIYDDYRTRIKAAAALHRQEVRPIWRKYYAEERERKQAFEDRERNVFGKVKNAFAATTFQHLRGAIDGSGKLSATFSNALSSQKRRAAFDDRLNLDKAALRKRLNAVLDGEVSELKTARKSDLAGQRQSLDHSRAELIERQNVEREKVREAWRQLRTRPRDRSVESISTEGNEPVKNEFDASRKPPAPAPKQPMKSATVSTPSPAPAPRGEVPRSTAQRRAVPAKNWKKSAPVQAAPRGLDGTEQASKDWKKTGAVQEDVQPPKDWGKKVERVSEIKKAPAPKRDLDRSR